MKTKSINFFCVIFFIYTLGLHAQDTESIVNGDFSAGNSGFTSDYTYCNSANCLFPEGFYAVGANPTFFHPDFFGTDHSTGTGNLMIINGKVESNKSVWCETISVNPGTEYIFSYWLSSMVTAKPAVLQLKINGVAIGSKFKAPTSLYVWMQFSVIWNSRANTSADICLVNLNTIAGGNDFGLDDISFKSNTSPVNVQDSLALVDLYNGTDGPDWYNHSGWLAGPVKDWYGIVINGNRVGEINLPNNNLNGEIPSSMGNVENLNRLELDSNQLSGSIPPELGNLKYLSYLFLDSNQLSGSLPSSFGNLAALLVLNARDNNLEGHLPSSLGNLSRLRQLILSRNKLNGNIPSSFANLKRLQRLRLWDNKLSGTLPSFLGTLPNLQSLSFHHNHYTFDGLETLVQNNSLDTFRYARQRGIDIHQNNNVLSVYAGGTLSNNTYKWFKDGALVSTITGDSTYAPTTSGNYSVEVTNSIATELTLYSDTVSFNTLKADQQNNLVAKAIDKPDFSVYPNPVRDILHVDNLKGNATISIITQDGRMVDTKIISNSAYAWNVKSLAAGTYYIRVEEDKKITLLKFIKQ